MHKTKEKGMWKRTFRLYTKFKIPYPLYIIQVVLGIISTKVTLLYVPYEADIKLGNFEDQSVIFKYVGLMLLMYAVQVITRIPEFYAEATVNRNLQNKLIHHSLRLPLHAFEKGGSQIVSWITQDCSFANGLITSVVGFITGIAATYMSITSISGIDKSMVYIAIGVLVYVIFSTWFSGRMMFLRERRGRIANAELTAYMAEHLSFFTEIKQLHSTEDELKRGKASIERFYKADVYQAVLTLVNLLVSGSTTNIISILVFLFGVKRVNDGAMTIEELAAFQGYILIAYQSVSSLPDLYTNFMYYNGILYYISSLMAEPEEDYSTKRSMNMQQRDIHFENVSFAYDEDRPVLKNVSFTIPHGKITMIVGPNGSGKTTIFKLLERFYLPDEGKMLYGSDKAQDFCLDEWRKTFGYVLQEPQLFDGTIKENIIFGIDREVSNDEIAAAAKLAGCDGFIQEFEEGYDFEIGENGAKLSAGQRQRIAIARAIIVDPSYLLLDEATCNMDIYSAKEVTNSLVRMMKGRTTVMISHDMKLLNLADYVIVINNGVVEVQGERNAVIQKSDTLKQLLNVQEVI